MNEDRLPRAWLIVGVLWVVAALNYLDRVMITTMRDSLTQAVPMTDAQINVGTLFPCAAGGLLVCGVLMVYVKPVRSTGS